MSSSKVSIIVPCYNQAEYIDECLESVFKQTFSDWECLIIDDGSKDNTEELVSKWCLKDTRFHYFKKENGGVSSARNFGIKRASAKFILPLDGDDKISENFVEESYNAINNSNDITLVRTRVKRFGEINDEWIMADYSYEKLLKVNMIVCTSMYRKSDWERVGGYDENMTLGLEDWEFLIALLADNRKVIKITDCFFYYRIKNESRNVDLYKSEDNVIKMQNYVFNKHMRKYTDKTCFELYNNYKGLQDALDDRQRISSSLERYLSLKQIIGLFIKRIKFLVVR